jgi:hypothetical protein
MDENSRHHFQFRLSDVMLAMTICCVVAAQLLINYPNGRIDGSPSTASRIIAGLNLVILVVAWQFYKSSRRRTLWIAAAATIVATIIGVLIGKLAD